MRDFAVERSEGTTQVPANIGPFRISRILGRGGMGVVYRGEHVDTGELAAIKTIRSVDGAMLASIRREIHALRRVHHPGIVRVVGEGVSDGRPWYAMPLLVGRTLRDVIQEGGHLVHSESEAAVGARPTTAVTTTFVPSAGPPPSVRSERVSYIRRTGRAAISEHLLTLLWHLCGALSHLHARGIVHRDLKPENIFVQDDGVPVLVDLGISARFGGARGREELDEAGAILMGTVAYMAPEQVRGDLADARADLYSLGCILYECVTGEPPFAGVPAHAVLYAHRNRRPLPPSDVVDGVPPELDRLIMQLLEKDPQNRLGYADDVARVLSGILRTPPSTGSTTPAYFYRPFFVGRDSALHEVRQAIQGLRLRRRGGLMWLGGESGVGKTRLAMEAVLEATRREVLVVASECAPIDVRSQAGTESAPLQSFVPVLLAVADRCRELGPGETRRLLGAHGKLLAAYEPTLAHVPGFDDLPACPAGDAKEARTWVLAGMVQTLFAMAETRSVLLVIDDLQWADELSLRLLQRLSSTDLRESGVLVLGTYRMDQTSDSLKKLVEAPESMRLEVARLSAPEVGAMVRGMLALRESEPPFLDYLHARSNGNPFFVVEYLRAAIAESLLVRNEAGEWVPSAPEPLSDVSLALPSSLAELIERRILDLDKTSRRLLDAASVLGREFEAELLFSCADVDTSIAMDALETLRWKQILEEGAAGRVRFVHDRLRELAYACMDGERVSKLHGQAAQAIQVRLGPESGGRFGELAHHYSRAGRRDSAAHFFELAGDHARRSYAMEAALRFYRSALEHLGEDGGDGGNTEVRMRLHETLGELMLFEGRGSEARAHLEASLSEETPDRLSRARRRRKLANVLQQQHMHGEALAAFALAEKELGDAPSRDASAYWHEYVQIQVEAAWGFYFQGRVDELDALVVSAQAAVEAHGDAAQRSRFFTAIAQSQVRRARYRVDQDALRWTRRALEAGGASADPRERAMAEFGHAFPLMLAGDLASAEPLFRSAIQGAERVADSALLTRFLAYFGLLLRLGGRAYPARGISERALGLAVATRMADYAGVARANLAWVALTRSDPAEVEEHARSAIEAWGKLPPTYVYPLQWVARLPYAAHLHALGQHDAALEHLAFLLREDQHRLEDRVLDAIRRCAADAGASREALLSEVFSSARTSRYL